MRQRGLPTIQQDRANGNTDEGSLGAGMKTIHLITLGLLPLENEDIQADEV
jgi:hypothetical protein